MDTLKAGATWCTEQIGQGIVWSVKSLGKGAVWLIKNTVGTLIAEAIGLLTNKYGLGWTLLGNGSLLFLVGFYIGGQDGVNIISIGTLFIMGAILYAFKKF